MKYLRNLALGVVAAMSLTACNYTGINDFALPGTEGSGDGSYVVKIQMANVGNLVPNNPVRMGDVDVGVIRKIELQGWRPLVTIRLNPQVRLPANATARVGQVSLLGAKYIEISPPKSEPAIGRLKQGSTISLARTGKYPETEDVLASVATLLNGGGLQQLRTITTELNKALDGRGPQFRDLLGQLNTLVSGLDAQKGDIVRAIDGIDRLGAHVAQQDAVIRGTLHDLPPALATLNRDRDKLVTSLQELGRFGDTFNGVVQRSSGTLSANVANLVPAVQKVADSGQDLVTSLDLIGTVTFPVRGVGELFRGDYLNLWATVDLTLGSVDRNLLTGTPAAGMLGEQEKLLGGGARPMVNPLLPPGSGLPGAGGLVPQPRPMPPAPVTPSGPISNPAPTGSAAPPPPTSGAPTTPGPGLLGGLLGGR